MSGVSVQDLEELLKNLDKCPERRVVARVLVTKHSLWAPRRNFADCAGNITVGGEHLSVNRLRKALNWLVWNGLAIRFIYDEMEYEESVHIRRAHTLERRGFYDAQREHWEYCPTAALYSLIGTNSDPSSVCDSKPNKTLVLS